ncbi:MAG TPA: hypothetical protein VF209_04700 [Patescibacteria group bacterium]
MQSAFPEHEEILDRSWQKVEEIWASIFTHELRLLVAQHIHVEVARTASDTELLKIYWVLVIDLIQSHSFTSLFNHDQPLSEWEKELSNNLGDLNTHARKDSTFVSYPKFQRVQHTTKVLLQALAGYQFEHGKVRDQVGSITSIENENQGETGSKDNDWRAEQLLLMYLLITVLSAAAKTYYSILYFSR